MDAYRQPPSHYTVDTSIVYGKPWIVNVYGKNCTIGLQSLQLLATTKEGTRFVMQGIFVPVPEKR